MASMCWMRPLLLMDEKVLRELVVCNAAAACSTQNAGHESFTVLCCVVLRLPWSECGASGWVAAALHQQTEATKPAIFWGTTVYLSLRLLVSYHTLIRVVQERYDFNRVSIKSFTHAGALVQKEDGHPTYKT